MVATCGIMVLVMSAPPRTERDPTRHQRKTSHITLPQALQVQAQTRNKLNGFAQVHISPLTQTRRPQARAMSPIMLKNRACPTGCLATKKYTLPSETVSSNLVTIVQTFQEIPSHHHLLLSRHWRHWLHVFQSPSDSNKSIALFINLAIN